jgi:hypothetical protein
MKSRNFSPISRRAAASPEIVCHMRRAASSNVRRTQTSQPCVALIILAFAQDLQQRATRVGCDFKLSLLTVSRKSCFLRTHPIAFRRVFRQFEVAVVNHLPSGFLLARMPQRPQAL